MNDAQLEQVVRNRRAEGYSWYEVAESLADEPDLILELVAQGKLSVEDAEEILW